MSKAENMSVFVDLRQNMTTAMTFEDPSRPLALAARKLSNFVCCSGEL